jgi:hypothetical protein
MFPLSLFLSFFFFPIFLLILLLLLYPPPSSFSLLFLLFPSLLSHRWKKQQEGTNPYTVLRTPRSSVMRGSALPLHCDRCNSHNCFDFITITLKTFLIYLLYCISNLCLPSNFGLVLSLLIEILLFYPHLHVLCLQSLLLSPNSFLNF